MNIVLVRHVETYGNVEKRLNGITESDYTERGLGMKLKLEEELININDGMPFDRVYVSPISRARKIGEAVANSLSIPLVLEDRIKEFNFGIFEGLTAEEAEALNPEIWQLWVDDYNHIQIPEGDQYDVYHEKIGGLIDEWKASHGDENILVVGHGGSVQSLLVQLLDLPLGARWHFKIELGGIVTIESNDGYGMLTSIYTPEYD